MIHRWLTLWALRRAYRVLFLDTGRPLRHRLAREARRVVVAAGVIVLALLALVAAVIVVLVQSLT